MTELDLLAATAPVTHTASLSHDDREALLRAIIATPPAARRRLTRPRTIGLVAGLAAVTAVAVGAVPLDGVTGPAPRANAAMEQLRTTAGETPADLLLPGQFRHLVTYLRSGSDRAQAESWIAADGRVWRWDTYTGTRLYYAFPPSSDLSTADPSPAYLATLPTSAAELSRYLQRHVSGSSSRNEAVFVAVGDLLRGGYAPARLRAAAVGVIERLPHVTVSQGSDDLGRQALEVTYTEPGDGPQTLLFDSRTSALLGESEGPLFAYAYVENTAPAVAADVLAHTHMPAADPPGLIRSSAPPATR